MAGRYQQARADDFIRLGLQLWAGQDRQKKADIQRAETVAESKRRFDIQESRAVKLGERQEERFEWEKAERKKRQDFEIMQKEFNVVEILNRSGNKKDAAARLSNFYNSRYPDGNEIRIVFKDDIENQRQQNIPGFEGREVAIFSKNEGMLPFKTMDELIRYTAANLNYDNYAKEYDAAMAKVADANARETPFTADDGEVYINTWILGPGGNLKRGPAEKFKDKMPAKKKTGLDLTLTQAEKALGRKLTPDEKEIKLGFRKPEKEKKPVDFGKKLDRYKKSLDLLLRRFVKKGSLGETLSSLLGEDSDKGVELTDTGRNALDYALSITGKPIAELTAKEKKLLPYAQQVAQLNEQIFGSIQQEYFGDKVKKGKGDDWRAYQRKPSARQRPNYGLIPAH
jgi:hypothetical protein